MATAEQAKQLLETAKAIQTDVNSILKTGTRNRGFGSMSPERRREIASKGGKAAHALGVAHKWTHNEAVDAGKRGGQSHGRNRKENMEQIMKYYDEERSAKEIAKIMGLSIHTVYCYRWDAKRSESN